MQQIYITLFSDQRGQQKPRVKTSTQFQVSAHRTTVIIIQMPKGNKNKNIINNCHAQPSSERFPSAIERNKYQIQRPIPKHCVESEKLWNTQ